MALLDLYDGDLSLFGGQVLEELGSPQDGDYLTNGIEHQADFTKKHCSSPGYHENAEIGTFFTLEQSEIKGINNVQFISCSVIY